MKPLLVIYTSLMDEENFKYFEDSLKCIAQDYAILHIGHRLIDLPRVELLGVNETITPIELKQLEKELIKKIKQ